MTSHDVGRVQVFPRRFSTGAKCQIRSIVREQESSMKIAVYDISETRQKLIRDWLIRFSFLHNMDFDILWLRTSSAIEKIADYASDLVISFVSLDSDTDLKFSDALHRANSDCRICFYKTGKTEIERYLIYRPSSSFVWVENETDFIYMTQKLFDDVFSSDAFFVYQTRTDLLCYAFRNIVFFESNLKYVTVHKNDRNDDTFFGRLGDVEKKVSNGFLRIHQSYLINPLYIKSIDKTSHIVYLVSGDALPISGRYYQTVLDRLEAIGGRLQYDKNAVPT